MTFHPKAVRRRRHIRHFYDACGWLIYGYAWVRVFSRTPRIEMWSFLLVFLASVALIHASALAWIGHNKRIARRGRRGLSTRYTSPKFQTDHLGRPLRIEGQSPASGELQVSVVAGKKIYSPAAALVEAVS